MPVVLAIYGDKTKSTKEENEARDKFENAFNNIIDQDAAMASAPERFKEAQADQEEVALPIPGLREMPLG